MTRAQANTSTHASSVLIVDLKGDPALLHGVHSSCRRQRVPFKVLCPQAQLASNLFNPCDQEFVKRALPEERALALRDALGLKYGSEATYPTNFWMRANTRPLLAMIREFPNVRSFHEIHQLNALPGIHRYLELTDDEWAKAQDYRSVIAAMARLPQLNLTEATVPHPDMYRDRIDLTWLASNEHSPEVVYAFLPATAQSSTVSVVGTLLLQTLFAAVNALPPSRRKRVWAFVDEFQILAHASMSVLFEQAASLGVSFLFSNQSPFSLPRDMLDSVMENTSYRQVFKANSDSMRKWLKERGGTTIRDYFTFARGASAQGGESCSTSIRETPESYFTDIDIMEGSANEDISWVEGGTSTGFWQYGGKLFPIITPHYQTRREYDALSRREWPTLGSAGIVAHRDEKSLAGVTAPTLPHMQQRPQVPAVVQTVQRPASATVAPRVKPILAAPEFESLAAAARQQLEAHVNALRKASNRKGSHDDSQ